MSIKTEFFDKVHAKELSFEAITPLRSAPSGQWQRYVPQITASVNPVPPANPLVTHEARYCILGKLLFLRYTFANASASFGTAGTGEYSVALPPGCVARQVFDSEAVGDAFGDDGSSDLIGVVTLETATDVSVRFEGGNLWGSSTLPFSSATLVTFSATIELV
jgi:hypothetical protein